MGDALSHAVLPGVAVSYMLGINMMIGATAFGLLAAVLIEFIIKKSKIKTDTSIGIILSSFFALGIILITKAESGADLNHILFGNVLAVTPGEILQSFIIMVIVLGIISLLYKEFLITSFDPVVSQTYGMNTAFYHYLLMFLLTIFRFCSFPSWDCHGYCAFSYTSWDSLFMVKQVIPYDYWLILFGRD